MVFAAYPHPLPRHNPVDYFTGFVLTVLKLRKLTDINPRRSNDIIFIVNEFRVGLVGNMDIVKPAIDDNQSLKHETATFSLG